MSKSNSFRIIAGQWRARRLLFPGVDSIRPTLDRVRETVFNWLSPHLPASVVLDAFAGSGALGFEALSRGAQSVTFVDLNHRICEGIKHNIRQLLAGRSLEDVNVVCSNVLNYLEIKGGRAYDVVFLDPPFHQGLLEPVLMALITQKKLADDALIYAEFEATLKWPQHQGLTVHKAKGFGPIQTVVWQWCET